jgi:hypothetical protein
MAQFASFIDPFIILLAIPPGITGVLAFLLLTGTTLNVMSLMGVIMMTGIVVSNSILIVDVTRIYRRQGMDIREAVALACQATTSGTDDVASHDPRHDPDGARARGGQRAVRTSGSLDHRRLDRISSRDGVLVPAAYLLIHRKAAGGGSMKASAHIVPFGRSLRRRPPRKILNLARPNAHRAGCGSAGLKSNPQISVSRLLAMASQQVTRQVKSSYFLLHMQFDSRRIPAGKPHLGWQPEQPDHLRAGRQCDPVANDY